MGIWSTLLPEIKTLEVATVIARIVATETAFVATVTNGLPRAII